MYLLEHANSSAQNYREVELKILLNEFLNELQKKKRRKSCSFSNQNLEYSNTKTKTNNLFYNIFNITSNIIFNVLPCIILLVLANIFNAKICLKLVLIIIIILNYYNIFYSIYLFLMGLYNCLMLIIVILLKYDFFSYLCILGWLNHHWFDCYYLYPKKNNINIIIINEILLNSNWINFL